jgi:hypothetical protein
MCNPTVRKLTVCVTGTSSGFDYIEVERMAISNELSSEIAIALLTAKDRSGEELTQLKNILLEVHTTLQELTERSRPAREAAPPVIKSASSHG